MGPATRTRRLARRIGAVPRALADAWRGAAARASLRTRVVLAALVPGGIMLALVAALASVAYTGATQALVTQRNAELARLSAAQITVEMSQYASALDRVAGSAEVRSGVPPRQQLALRLAVADQLVFDGGVVVLDGQGRVVAADPRRADVVGADWSAYGLVATPDPARGGLAGGTLGSNAMPLGPQGRPVVAVSLPIWGEHQQVAGTAVGLVEIRPPRATMPNALQRSLGRLRQTSPSAGVRLVDGRGTSLGLDDVGRAGEDLSALSAVQSALAEGTGSVRTRGADGREVIASYAPVTDTDWVLLHEEDWAALLAPAARFARLALSLLVVALALPAAVLVLTTGRIVRPVAELTRAARRMAEGDLHQVVDLPPQGELRELAEAFNGMSSQLLGLYASLERRVADRTRELATLNAVAAVVSRSLDLDDVLSAALRETLCAVDADAGLAFALGRDEDALVLVAHRGAAPRLVAGAAHLPLPPDAAGPSTDATPWMGPPEDLTDGTLAALLAAEGWERVIGVPLTARGRLQGELVLRLQGGREVPPEEATLLGAIGRQVGVAVENARLYASAEVAAVAAERNRLARELHDSVTQTLFSANLIAGVLPLIWERDPAAGMARLEELHRLTAGALAEMRTLLLELRPAALAGADLATLLRQLAEGLGARARVPIHLSLDDSVDLPTESKLALYRIAQEALNNVAKHSGATRAVVELAGEPDGATGAVELSIRDNGRGFRREDVPAGHLGLGIMAERAEAVGARCTVESEPGRGTVVRVTWRHPGDAPPPAGPGETPQ